MKSQRWLTTLIGLAMLGIIGVLVIVGGVYFWRNSSLHEPAVNGTEAEVTVTGTDEASDTASVGGDSEESTPAGPTPSPTATPTGTLPPTVTPLPAATDTPVPTNTPIPAVPTDTAVPPAADDGNEDFTSYDDNQAMLNLVNQERCAQGLTPVTYNKLLYITALQHSVDMLHNDFFDHQGSDGSMVEDRATSQGYGWLTIGENIAAGQIDTDEVFTDWMNSPGHRDNILKSEFREMAVAHIFRDVSTYGHYWTQVFGSTGTDPISCTEAGY